MRSLHESLFMALADLRKAPMQLCAALGLSPAEFFTLQSVRRIGLGEDDPCGPPEEVHVSGLQHNGHFSMSGVSQSVSALERKGYVVRSMSERDRRRISVTLTPQGERFLQQADAAVELLMQRTQARFGEAEMRQLLAEAARLQAALEEARLELTGPDGMIHMENTQLEGEKRI